VTEPVFGRRAVVWLAGLLGGSFLAFLAVLLFGDRFERAASSAPDSSSRSALGHAAFVVWAKAAGFPVVVSRHASASRAGRGTGALLVLAEPDASEGDEVAEGILRAAASTAGAVLVALPKRWGREDEKVPGRLAEVGFHDASVPDRVLSLLGVSAHVTRPEGSTGPWASPWGPLAPTIPGPQLLAPGAGVESWIRCDRGILLGRMPVGDRSVWVLSDPDLLENHGLPRGDNAPLLARVLEEVRPGGGALVVDETLHGDFVQPSVWRALFRMPLAPATASVGIALLVLLWAALTRHGAPLPAADPIAAGRRVLVESTAELLHGRGHDACALRLYLAAATQQVLRASHAPAGLSRAEADAWVERARRARDAETSLPDLRAAVEEAQTADDPHRTLRAARRVHAWRQEMVDGSRRSP
jgi:hypothetical protein